MIHSILQVGRIVGAKSGHANRHDLVNTDASSCTHDLTQKVDDILVGQDRLPSQQGAFESQPRRWCA